jgi:hypothetical protein
VDPAVLADLTRDPRRAIFEDGIVCLACGRVFRHLTNTHLDQHGLTSVDYKQRFGYNGGRSLMALSVRRVHGANAIRLGLADQIRSRPIVANPALRWRGGSPARTLEERLRRRDNGRIRRPLPPRDPRGRFAAAPVESRA